MVIAGIIAVMAFRAWRYGGVKASFFGARITRTAGEIKVQRGGFLRTKLKVHSLQEASAAEPRVGLELTYSPPQLPHAADLAVSARGFET